MPGLGLRAPLCTSSQVADREEARSLEPSPPLAFFLTVVRGDSQEVTHK